MNFMPMNFISSLGYMIRGMFGIFVVIAIIIAAVMILNKVTAKKD